MDPQIDALVKEVQKRKTAYTRFVKTNLNLTQPGGVSNDNIRNALEATVQKTTNLPSVTFFKKLDIVSKSLLKFVDDTDDGALLKLEIEEIITNLERLSSLFRMLESPRTNPLRAAIDVVVDPTHIPSCPTPPPLSDDEC